MDVEGTTILSIRRKIVFIGNPSTGKTSLLNRICNDKFLPDYDSTIGVDFFTKTIYYNENIFKIQLWDSAGQEKYRALIPSYLRGASIIFLVYDLTWRESFEAIKSWLGFVNQYTSKDQIELVLVGNESDLERKAKSENGSLKSGGKIAAVGETGLDYHYDFSPRDIQVENFRKNIRLALKYGLPLIVHDREAHEDSLKVLLEENAFSGKVLFHCFSGSAEFAQELLKYGCMFSFGGAVTFKNARKFEGIFKVIPPEHILPETDSPYMAPEPKRGTRNDSSNLQYIYPRLAVLSGMNENDFEEQMIRNTRDFFGIII